MIKMHRNSQIYSWACTRLKGFHCHSQTARFRTEGGGMGRKEGGRTEDRSSFIVLPQSHSDMEARVVPPVNLILAGEAKTAHKGMYSVRITMHNVLNSHLSWW